MRLGDGDEAERYFKRATRAYDERVANGADDPATKYYIACLWALRGDADRAIRHLEETIAALPWLNRRRATTDPDFDSIRDDPRFGALVAAAG